MVMMQAPRIRREFALPGGRAVVFSLPELERQGLVHLDRLPYSLRVLLENSLRAQALGRAGEDWSRLANWQPNAARETLDFWPCRVLLQDFTGVPLVVDLAAMRAEVAERGGDPRQVNPVVPVDLVIDHSVQVDAFGDAAALRTNMEREYERNGERYALLRWAQGAFRRLRVVPPGAGIVHQVNLEYLAGVVVTQELDGHRLVFPDTLVGTDSHTTMVNGLGVLGWGVGGIEAEAVMLGGPYSMKVPDVIGVRLRGQLPPGSTATDLVLTVTEMLRAQGVVEKFVEFCGPGLDGLGLADRATIANMAPEFGATAAFFPVDAQTLAYLRGTGRSEEHVALVERYCKEQGLFRGPDAPEPEFSLVLTMDLGTVQPSLAGPRRPQDRLSLAAVPASLPRSPRAESPAGAVAVAERTELEDGAVAIAAITSCTNTSNPGVMLAAGLLARRAVDRGLRVPRYVKTSLAPGSRVVTQYLRRAGLLEPLEALGFAVVGYGCTTCIGNSGPVTPEAERAADQGAVLAAVLSGNRNFQGRINSRVRANYLASPPLVVAYALAGTVTRNLETEPLGRDASGAPVHLSELWPSPEEVAQAAALALDPDLYRRNYADIFAGDERWWALPVPAGDLYAWDSSSTYVRRPPFFSPPAELGRPFSGARVLCWLGDSVTTDDISPAGEIAPDGDAAAYLAERGVPREGYHSYGARRGNHEVMMRGTFGNVRLRNRLAPGTEGPRTILLPDGEPMSIFAASEAYAARGVPLVVLAGRDYGSGSSRDWAAKGPVLLGVRAVLAQSFERIHRGNLVGMGVLPLQFPDGVSSETLGLDGHEEFSIQWSGALTPGRTVQVTARRADGREVHVDAVARVETQSEVEHVARGGILPSTLAQVLASGPRGPGENG